MTQSGEPNYAINLKKERVSHAKKQWLLIAAISIVVIAIISFFISIDKSLQIYAGWITLTKLLGIAISVLLLMYELDKSNVFIKNRQNKINLT